MGERHSQKVNFASYTNDKSLLFQQHSFIQYYWVEKAVFCVNNNELSG